MHQQVLLSTLTVLFAVRGPSAEPFVLHDAKAGFIESLSQGVVASLGLWVGNNSAAVEIEA